MIVGTRVAAERLADGGMLFTVSQALLEEQILRLPC
jgi:hypothetical protein